MNSFLNKLYSGSRRYVLRSIDAWRIMKFAGKIDANSKDSTGRTVVVFNASTRLEGVSQNAAFSLITSWALKLQGVKVVQLICNSGMQKCVLGTDVSNINNNMPCDVCIRQSKILSTYFDTRWFGLNSNPDLESKLKNLNLDQLQSFEYEDFPFGEIVLPSLRWILRRHHLKDYADIHKLYKQYIFSAWNVKQEFDRLIEEVNPQAVVLFNGMFFPEAVARKVAQNNKIPVYTHEVSLQPLTAFFTEGEATAYPITIPDSFQLNDEQNKKLDDYLSRRFEGNFTMAGIQFWPEMQGIGQEIIQKINGFKQIIPVFTNVVFDTSQGHANVIFKHMFEWLDEILQIIKAHPETLFIIRAHPDELRAGKSSHENVANWVKKNRLDQFDNVVFINAKEFVSSYELIRRSKFVMVYNSTIGLEASIMGAAVLCGGKARFTQLPTVFYPEDKDDFKCLAEKMLSDDEINIPEKYKVNARRFLYFQLYISSLPFDAFIKNDGVWNGYVSINNLEWQDLLPENSRTINTLLKGIIQGEEFLLDYEA